MADHGARAHATYAPSAAYRWMRCRGSIRLSRGVPEGPSSIYAEEGTQCHEAADLYLSKCVPLEKACKDLSDEQKLIVEEYVDFCTNKWEDARQDDSEAFTERRMHAPGISPHFFGTGDFAILNRTTGQLRFVDLKAGAVPVYVRDREGRVNPQLASYLLLLLSELGAPVAPWHFDPLAVGVREMIITIVQPRVYDAPQSTRVTAEELEEFLQDLCRTIDAIEAGDDTLCAGEWCKFCPAKGACPELRQEAVRRARMDFEAVDPLPLAEWAAILAEAEMIAAHVQGIRAKIRAALEQGHRVPGFKLVTKRQLQEWTDWSDAELSMRFAGFNSEELYKRTPISPAAAQKLARVKKVKLPWPDFVTKRANGLTIAPDSDPRPEVNIEPGADFALDDEDPRD